MVINTNIEAQATANNLNASQLNLAKSLARLSSGSKIIVPSDDAAGLAVSSRLNSQIKRLDSALSNVVNAVSFTQTQDGFMKTIDKAFRRMGELAILSQDTTKSDEDRALYNQEFVQLKSYVQETTKQDFNGVSLFAGQTLDVTVDAEGTTFTMVGINLSDPTYTSAINTGTDSWKLTSAAYMVSRDGFELNSGVTAYKSTVDLWRAEIGGTWSDTDSNVAQVDTITIDGDDTTDADTFTIEINGTDIGPINWVTDNATTATNIANAINNDATVSTAVTATTSGDDVIITSDVAGTAFTLTDPVTMTDGGGTSPAADIVNTTANSTSVKYVVGSVVKENILTVDSAATKIDPGGFLANDPVPASDASTAHLVVGDRVARKAGQLITVDPGSEDPSATTLGIGEYVSVKKSEQDISAIATELGNDYDDVNLKSVEASQIALYLVKQAITQVATDRAKLGAVQSRLNFTNEQLTVTKENLSAAISRIADVDVAEEATNYARYQILVASGTEMLKQANQLPQSALQLLR